MCTGRTFSFQFSCLPFGFVCQLLAMFIALILNLWYVRAFPEHEQFWGHMRRLM